MVKSQYVSWSEIENTVQVISKKILKSSKDFSSITTISRGGLIPSRLLADLLGIEKSLLIKILFLLIPCLLMIFLILEKLFLM